jgi:Fe-S oxidoreductase
VLRTVLPDIIDGFDIEVLSYLEVLATERPELMQSLDADVAVHDSCVYARFEGVIEQPRELLKAMGTSLREPDLRGKMTHCCGGPIESLFPTKARAIAEKRIEQLVATGAPEAVTMCPICLLNLREAAPQGFRVRDISEVLAEGFCHSKNQDIDHAAA